MKQTIAVALILGLAACGEQPNLAPVAQAAAPKAITAEVARADPDKELAQRVMRAIGESKLDGIEAAAADGVVTLWGTTVNAKDRHRAGDIAARVEGVKAVENRLEIVSGS
jgi:osmotically-inducible protein OsmY